MAANPADVKQQIKIVRRKVKVKASETFGFPIGTREDGTHLDEVEAFEDYHPMIPPPLHKLDADYEFDQDTVKALIYAVQEEENTLLTGGHGCGKTSHPENVLMRLKYGFITVSCNCDKTVSDLLGYTKLGPQGFQRHYGPLPRAMKLGIPLILSEVNKLLPGVQGSLNDILDGRMVHIEDTGETIIAKKGFVVLATDNTAGGLDESMRYRSSLVQGADTMSRYRVHRVPYLTEDKEIRLLTKKFGQWMSDELVTRLVKFANATREAAEKREMHLQCSTRELVKAAKLMVANNGDAWSAFEDYYFNRLGSSDLKKAVMFFETHVAPRPTP